MVRLGQSHGGYASCSGPGKGFGGFFICVCVFFVCLFVFRVGLRLKKIEQKVQRSRIYPSPPVSPVINMLY